MCRMKAGRREWFPTSAEPSKRQAELRLWARLSNRPPFIYFDHGGKRRKFQRARLQSARAAPPVKRFSVVRLCVLQDFCMVICCGGGERGRAVFQRNALKFARRAQGCVARWKYTRVIVLSQAEMKQWINSSVMTLKFESALFCSNLTCESNLTVEKL